MRKKPVFYTEAAYACGLILLAFSAALMEKANLGVSMVVAPAYLFYLKLSQTLPFFTFGMAEYTLQACLLLVLILVLRKFKLYYLFSFVTAVLYGFLLDGAMALVAFFPMDPLFLRLVFFSLGVLLCALSIALLFQTYIAPEVYELFVKELAQKYDARISAVKTVYDCVSCFAAILLSFAFFGLFVFEGVKIGTIFCALINGFFIGRFTDLLLRVFDFRDKWSLRRFFT